MLRYGAEDHLIAPRSVDSEDNVADLLTKPLTGETFIRLRRIALGTAYQARGEQDEARGEAGPIGTNRSEHARAKEKLGRSANSRTTGD